MRDSRQPVKKSNPSDNNCKLAINMINAIKSSLIFRMLIIFLPAGLLLLGCAAYIGLNITPEAGLFHIGNLSEITAPQITPPHLLTAFNTLQEHQIKVIFLLLGVSLLGSWKLARTHIRNQRIETELRIGSIAFESEQPMVITDAYGIILKVNQIFSETTGYALKEVVGQPTRLFKSNRHNAEFYREMWVKINQTGTWQGEVWNKRKNGELYPNMLHIYAVKGQGDDITHYVGSYTDLTERKEAEEQIMNLAFYDPLTDLPNRRLLLDRLSSALAFSLRNSKDGALLFIDLDRFKILNDTLGHDSGDLLLQQAGLRLKTCVREVDTVARIGGDEFVVMLEDLHQQEAAKQTKFIAEKILTALSQPYQLGAHEFHCSASIGITLFSNAGKSLQEQLKQADIALYQAKNAGRNRLCFFDQSMQEAVNQRAELESELRLALKNKQFYLSYQAQLNSSGHVLGAEVLLRWTHPERGTILPAEFIPVAEESGLILEIGLWVLKAACEQLKRWQADSATRDLVLSINVSARQFSHPGFALQVQITLQEYDIIPERLKLELTEGMLLNNFDESIITMNTLRKIGVQFALDDFGTGYSSLQHLKRQPLAQIKIDQKFIHELATNSSDQAIVRTIIAMANGLGMEVIAEGVETEAQRTFLLQNGCTNYQGHLFGKPGTLSQFEAMLQ